MLVAMSVNLLTLILIAANLLGGTMAVPQAARLLRSRKTAGVSPVWAGISTAVNAWWIAYGLGVGDLAIVPVSVVSVIAYLAIIVFLVRFGDRPAMPTVVIAAASAAASAALPLLVLTIGGWPSAGIALGAMYGVQLSPAVVAVYRSVDVSGVSAATWALAFLEAALWGVYGFARVDAGLLTLAATGLAMSALVLVRLFARRPRLRGGYRGLDLAPA